MMTEILEKARRTLEACPLCDHCLGRQFALLGHGLDNGRRGEALKILLTMEGQRLASRGEAEGLRLLRTLAVNGSFGMAAGVLRRLGRRAGRGRECHLCGGRFGSVAELAEKSVEGLGEYEYTTFLVGVKLPVEVEEREDEFKAQFGVEHGESMRNEFSREVGKRVSEATGREADYKRPDVVVMIHPFAGGVTVQANPLYVAGRYRKLVRGIPQSRWLCRECGGKGCPRCQGTGKMYPESVGEIIAAPILREAGGEDALFHAAGREDIDARMLGRGRPFVLEVKRPRRRFLDLRALREAVNEGAGGKVRVSGLRLVDLEAVGRLKGGEGAEKVYRVIVEFDRAVSDGEVEALEKALTGVVVRQRTPRRVVHRRSDRVREKHIYETRVRRLKPNRVEMRVRCEGGLYIKELTTGDGGRTEPSVAEIVGAQASPLELDVMGVGVGDG